MYRDQHACVYAHIMPYTGSIIYVAANLLPYSEISRTAFIRMSWLTHVTTFEGSGI